MKGLMAGIVTYNPDEVKLYKLIDSIRNQVKNIIIVDNNSANKEFQKFIIETYKRITIINNSENMGIAYALNQLFAYGCDKGYEYILTFDQDSECNYDFVNNLIQSFDDNVAIVGPLIKDRNKKTDLTVYKGTQYVDRCITSGSITKVSAWKAVNGFDEWMFIDGVDDDFCDRLKAKGYKLVRNNDVVLSHEIGSIEIRKFILWPVIVRNHSAFRKYYIVRNIIYLSRKENNGNVSYKAMLKVFKQIVLVLLYENEKNLKIKRMIKGIGDGFKAKINLN